MQKRQLECVKYENKEQRHTWLENMHTEHVSESKIQMKSKYTGGLKNSRGVSKMKMKSKDKCGQKTHDTELVGKSKMKMKRKDTRNQKTRDTEHVSESMKINLNSENQNVSKLKMIAMMNRLRILTKVRSSVPTIFLLKKNYFGDMRFIMTKDKPR